MDLNTMITQGLTHLVISELHLCQSYLERLYYSIEYTDVQIADTQMQAWMNNFVSEHKTFLYTYWLGKQSFFPAATHISFKQVKDFTRYLFSSLTGITALEIIDEDDRSELYAQTLNRLYKNTHSLHLLLDDLFQGHINIDLPRTLLMQDQLKQEQGSKIPLFLTTSMALQSVLEDNDTPLQSLAIQRERKYSSMLKESSELIANKNYPLAQDTLKKALNLKETAKAYNLLSWCHSLQGDTETAKSLCIKAIKTDPAHGAAYNDLGSYLLAEGNFKESLKWFELAKNSRQYDNREFAFINAGRAYMELREYKKALGEFSLALTLAPDNETLHETVYKLKERLNRSEIKKDLGAPPPLF